MCPDLSELLCNIQAAMKHGPINGALERLSSAARYIQSTLNLPPQDVFLWEQFGVHLILTGEVQALLDLLPKMVNTYPWTADIHSHMLLNLHNLPDIDPVIVFEAHKRWAEIHAPENKTLHNHDNDPSPDRILRIGYISPDFRLHPVGFFVEPIIEGHDRNQVEVFGYANVAKPCAVTERFMGLFDHYRDIAGMESQALANLIRSDRIDILVDLAGHTTNNNLPALVYKPAPIQVSYLGYPGTTGMTQMDYRMVDACVNDPASQTFYTEKLVFLPAPFACARHCDSELPESPLPCERNGFITFGSFKNNCKINTQILAVWAKILKANEQSRLLLRFRSGDQETVQNHYLRQFESLGISRQRIEMGGSLPYLEHIRQYERVDIELDTFPFNGHKTSFDALWMGVPVITLAGHSFASRLGLDLLQSIDLSFFAADTEEAYVTKACALAKNTQALAKIRSGMRDRIRASALFNTRQLVSNIENAYRSIWHTWCNKHA